MPIESGNHNIVLLAKQFRPSMFSDYWLINAGAARPNSIKGTRVSTEKVSKLSTYLFDLVVTDDRLQITLNSPETHTQAELLDPLGKMLDGIPDPGYTTVGLNHVWQLTLGRGTDLPQFSRRRFAIDNDFAKVAGGGDAVWGAVVHRTWKAGSCRTSVQPVFADHSRSKPIGLLVDCNFQFVIPETQTGPSALGCVKDAAAHFADAHEFSYSIALAILPDADHA